ncbi:beta-lactamase [Colletotrichum karsti]|uniref:Beta-lactamase n=1 Tax=Colletotrichum karsti TaxID=1095194 RepID=A0A9P6I9F3_9PEZI|nr:beta-lactamase [Colletotrichum karsti]KAF9878197.1 beta-lactamase [Colletotrichum karsti]
MASLDAILAKYTAGPGQDTKDKVLGATLVVLNKDGLLYNGSAGRIDHAPDSKPWKDDTFCMVASMTKIVTATAIMQLVEQGVLNLDVDVRDIVPQLRQMPILRGFTEDEQPILEDHDTPVSLRMLLTHTVGLGYDLADDELMRWHKAVGRKVTNLDWSLEGFTTPLKFKPGEGWFYGTAVDWAGQVLEKVTGKTLGEYMTENIFEPLGMKDTGFWPEKLPHVAERTAAWAYRGEDQVTLGPGPRPCAEKHPVESGGAGLFTTAADYAKFLHALLTHKIVKKETVDEMFRPQLDEKIARTLEKEVFRWHGAVEFERDMGLSYGLSGCINMRDAIGKRKKGSMTWSGMANSHWWMDRESGIAAALFVQLMPFGDPVVVKLYDELERAVYKDLLGEV